MAHPPLPMTPETAFGLPRELLLEADRFSAVLLSGLIRFGCYPDTEKVRTLEKMGYSIFLDLTAEGECTPYTTSKGVTCKREPINDRRVPYNVASFSNTVEWVLNLIKKHTFVYVHCRGGHGRAALFSACVLAAYAYSHQSCTWADTEDPDDVSKEVLALVYHAHQHRTEMDAKWRKMGAPQTVAQKAFVRTYVQGVHDRALIRAALAAAE